MRCEALWVSDHAPVSMLASIFMNTSLLRCYSQLASIRKRIHSLFMLPWQLQGYAMMDVSQGWKFHSLIQPFIDLSILHSYIHSFFQTFYPSIVHLFANDESFLSIYSSFHPTIHSSIHQFIHPSYIHSYIPHSFHLRIYLIMFHLIHPSIHLSFHSFSHSIHPSILRLPLCS